MRRHTARHRYRDARPADAGTTQPVTPYTHQCGSSAYIRCAICLPHSASSAITISPSSSCCPCAHRPLLWPRPAVAHAPPSPPGHGDWIF
eukprot:1961430-Prymnesium_polylepis.1